MTRRSPSELFAAERAAGLTVPEAIIATAIALAESGGDDTSLGDVGLETAQWGPSVGAWQIRTIKSETGTGQDRDISALQGNLARQAQAMVDISSGGVNWQPWTTYDTGKYKQFLTPAQQAANGVSPDATAQGSAGAGAGGIVASPAVNPLDPLNITGMIGDALNNAVGAAVAPARNLLLKITVVVLGLGLVGFGLARATHATERTEQHFKKGLGEAEQAASLAALA